MRSLKVIAAAAALVVTAAAPAAAHVTVQPSEAAQGSYAKLALRVPNERDDASTVRLEVQLPDGEAFAGARVRPMSGWSVEVTDTSIVWSGGTIAPGQFEEFEISAGPLPEVDEVVFKALQTYDDGEVVSWIEEATEGAAEPERPAPVLRLTADGGDGHGAVADDHGSATDAAAADAAADDLDGEAAADDLDGDAGVDEVAAADTGDDDDGNGAVVGAYVLGGLGAVLGAAALVRSRRRGTA